MYLAQFGLLATIALLVKAAPQDPSNYYPEHTPYETSTPIQYQYPDFTPDFPIPDDGIFSPVQQPNKTDGISFFLVLDSGSNHHNDDVEHKDFNVIVGFFNGINDATRNNLESIARNIQSALESNANFKDGRLAELLKNSGLFETKSLEEFKNSLQACKKKATN